MWLIHFCGCGVAEVQIRSERTHYASGRRAGGVHSHPYHAPAHNIDSDAVGGVEPLGERGVALDIERVVLLDERREAERRSRALAVESACCTRSERRRRTTFRPAALVLTIRLTEVVLSASASVAPACLPRSAARD